MKVCDMHCDTIYVLNDKRLNNKQYDLRNDDLNINLNKMIEGDYLLQNFAIFTDSKNDGEVVKHVMDMIDTLYLEIDKNKDLISLVYNYQDIINNINNNKLSAMLTLEEGGVINNDLSYLRNYYRLGVRMITLTWNYYNGIGYPNFDYLSDGYNQYDNQNGLTEFGIEYVKEMERLGIIIDVSHLSDKGFYDVLNNTTKPFVASHSNARALCPHARNMNDDMIKELANRRGVIGINYASDFLNDKGDISKIEDMIKHIDYIKSIGGIDCIGLGSDFDGIPQNLEMKDCSKLPMLEKALYEHGYSKEEVEKIFYKNVLRLYKEVLK